MCGAAARAPRRRGAVGCYAVPRSPTLPARLCSYSNLLLLSAIPSLLFARWLHQARPRAPAAPHRRAPLMLRRFRTASGVAPLRLLFASPKTTRCSCCQGCTRLCRAASCASQLQASAPPSAAPPTSNPNAFGNQAPSAPGVHDRPALSHRQVRVGVAEGDDGDVHVGRLLHGRQRAAGAGR